MSKEEKQRKAASNRLLDILRAQQTTEEASKTEDQKESIEKEAVSTKPESTEATSKEQEVTKPDTEDTEIAAPMEPEQPEAIEDIDQETGSEEIVLEEPEIGMGAPEVADERLEPTAPEAIAEDLLLKSRQKTADLDTEDVLDVVPPFGFNSSLHSTLDEPSAKFSFKNFFRAIFNRFNDSHVKITVHSGEKSIWVMQQRSKLKGVLVEKYKKYTLPLDYGGETITEIDTLISHVLRMDFGRVIKKVSFGAYFSAQEPAKTQALETPQLKQKEMEDLVDWNSKKNLPFGIDDRVVNWRLTKGVGDSKMRNIVLGVKDKPSIDKNQALFDKNGINLRFTSTLPILLWKSFVKNYPEKNTDTIVLVHIAEVRTTVIVIAEQKLLLSREIAIGANDFYQAIMQKITSGENTVDVDFNTAVKILNQYGFTQDIKGLSEEYQIDLYKIGILLRPVVERMTSELSRSLNYFKNQNGELEWDGMMFDGIGASFPNLVEAIQESVFLETEVLNPMRVGQYLFTDEFPVLSEDKYSSYSINFALASDAVIPYNILPLSIRQAYKYGFRSKLVGSILAIMVPLFIFTAMIANLGIDRMERSLERRGNRYNELAAQTHDYESMKNDIVVFDTYFQFLSNDSTYSENQIKVLKLFSTIIPEEIKLTTLTFNNAINTPDSISTLSTFTENLFVSGFVESELAVSELYLTDFQLKIEGLAYFSDVNLLSKAIRGKEDDKKLNFALNMGLTNE